MRCKRVVKAALAAAALGAISSRTLAQTFTWTSVTNANFSNGPWTSAAPAYGGGSSVGLLFSNSGGGGFTATNDLGPPFVLDQLFFPTIGSGGSINLANAPGNFLQFVDNGTTDATIQNNGFGTANLNGRIDIANVQVRIFGSPTATISFNAPITGTGTLALNQVDTLFTAPSNFAGQTVVNNGPQFVSIAANNALGSGSITWSSGILQNPSAGTTTPNLVTLANPINLTGQLTYSAPFQADVALTGSLSGFGSLNITGAGALHLSGSNSFNGNIVFNDGTSSLTAQLFAAGQSLPGNQITFSGPGAGELVLTSTGTINSGINASAGATAIFSAGNDQTTLNLGSFGGAGTILLGAFPNAGTVNLIGLSLGATDTGPIEIANGVVRVDGSSRFGSAPTLLFDGGSMYLPSSTTIGRPIVVGDYTAMNVAPGQVGTIDQGASVAPGFISDAILKTGGGTLLISGNTSTARWIIDTGTLQLGNTTGATGSINYSTPNFPGMTINSGATLAKNTFDGLQHAGTILMAGGTLQLNSSDSMGTLALTANTQSIITAGSSATFAGIAQPPGAAISYTAPGLGSTTQIQFTAAPGGSLLVGGGGGVGTPNISILAGATASDTITTGFATDDPTVGVRELAASEYSPTITSGASTLNNASIDTGASLTSPTTINSLMLTGSATISGATSLAITSGMIISQGGTINVSTLSLGNGMLISTGTLNIPSVITGSSLLIAGNVTLTGSNTYAGPTIVSAGSLLSSGSERIPNSSTVYINSGAQWNISSGTETVAGISQQDVVSSGCGPYGTISLNNATLVVGSGDVSSDFAGQIVNAPAAIGMVRKIGAGVLNLSGSNSFSGGVIVQQGILRAEAQPMGSSPDGNPSDFQGAVLTNASADGIFGTGSINLLPAVGSSAELKLGRDVLSLSRAIVIGTPIANSGTSILSTDIDPYHGTVLAGEPLISSPITLNSELQLSLSTGTLSGLISGIGSIVIDRVAGEDFQPIVTINSNNSSFTGTTTIVNGSLYVNGQANISGVGALGSATSPIALGTGATTGYAELSCLDSGGTFARPITVTPGQAGSTLALSARMSGGIKLSSNISLGAVGLDFFSAPAPGTIGSAGEAFVGGQITGSGSLIVGFGISSSNLEFDNTSSTFSGGVMLTDGSLGFGGSGGNSAGPIGTGGLNIDGTTLAPTLYAEATGRSIANPLFLNSDLVVAGTHSLTFTNTMNHGSSERTITVNTSTLTFNGAISGSGALNKDGFGIMHIGSSNSFTGPVSVFAGALQFDTSQTLASLNIGGNARTAVTGGVNAVLRMSALNIASGGALDLNDDDAIVDYTGTSPLPRITQLLAEGYNGGTWNGNGITSAVAQSVALNAANPNKTAIGFAEASSLGLSSFDGQPVDSTAILLKYTHAGDANLDGKVNAQDFDDLASNYGKQSRTWLQGDFNYDGQVNSLDFNALAANFNSAPAAPALGTLVPEPIDMLPACLLLLPRARRRR